MKKVLIPTKLESIAAELLTAREYMVICDADTPLMEQAQVHSDAFALIVRSEKITPEIIDAFPDLKLIVRAGAGFDTIDIAYARKRGVDVMNTPGANANAVAEEVVALVLAQYRHIVPGDITTRAGQWEKKNFMGSELTGKTVGIVGLGNIGRLVARRMSGFDVKVLGYDPVISSIKAQDMGIELISLKDLFTRCDIITLHVPGGEQTRDMVDESLLLLMKPGAVLVNCARCGVVNEAALRNVRQEKVIHYLNDVYPEDKAGEKSVADIADIMLPHLGASTIEANLTAARRAAEQLTTYVEHGISTCVVNKGTPDDLDARYQYLAYSLAHMGRLLLDGMPVRMIETTFYGKLAPFAQWFYAPILAGLSPDMDRGLMPGDAKKIMDRQGVILQDRTPDESKGYGHSMTLDFIAEKEHQVAKVSLRGTLAEGLPMISRLNQFNRLYFEVNGNNLILMYKDRPGVLARITAELAAHDINIEDAHVPRDPKGDMALACLKTNKPVPREIVQHLSVEIDATVAFSTSLG